MKRTIEKHRIVKKRNVQANEIRHLNREYLKK